MTDEQIKQNAHDYTYTNDHNWTWDDSGESRVDISAEILDAYLAGAHSRDEEIKELKKQIERLSQREQMLFDREVELIAENDKLRNPWISVEERLPEERKTVLLWFGGYYTAAILRDGEWWNCTGWHSGGGWSALDKIQDIAASYITHWMYIPEPPEQTPPSPSESSKD